MITKITIVFEISKKTTKKRIEAPLVGLGNLIRYTAIVFLIMAALTLFFSYVTRPHPADHD